ncbi:MAG: hypothetical protein RL701_6614 [Pseudomonadota bacterium]
MKAQAQKVVTIEYTLTDDDGKVVDTSDGRAPLSYLHGANNIVPGLEKALDGAEAGQEIEVVVEPADGYGAYNEGMVQNVPVRKLPEKRPQPGAVLKVQTPTGQRLVLVKSVQGDYATLDFNHPLAGATLHFKVKVIEVRDPTEEETAHGHAHTPGQPH